MLYILKNFCDSKFTDDVGVTFLRMPSERRSPIDQDFAGAGLSCATTDKLVFSIADHEFEPCTQDLGRAQQH
jgi:hypothetical protein